MRTKCLFVIVQIIIFTLRLDIDTSKKLKGNSQKINYKVYFTYAAFFIGEKKNPHKMLYSKNQRERKHRRQKHETEYIYHAPSNWLKVSL